MAKVKDNIVTAGLQGKVGNLVFRKRNNKTTAYVMSSRKVQLSVRQKAAQARFAEAVAKARQVLKNEKELKHFSEIAVKNGKESAYSAAISYFMNNPDTK